MCDLWSLRIQKHERFKTLAVFGQKTGSGGRTGMLEVSTRNGEADALVASPRARFVRWLIYGPKTAASYFFARACACLLFYFQSSL